MLPKEKELPLSPYSGLYDILIKSDNELRQINELVDFSFIYNELKDKYCPDNGRTAEAPVRMFKYLLLKDMYQLSDRGLVKRAYSDLSFKYFLELRPEDDVIDPSLLSKFRCQRLKDMDLLDMLIGKTVELAMEKGLIKSKTLIVDATHTASRFNPVSPVEALRLRSKLLRKTIYSVDENMKSCMPEKNATDDVEKEIEYTTRLLHIVKSNEKLSTLPKIEEKINYLEEVIEDCLANLPVSTDKDATIGHKSGDTSFFGYKSHIGITRERIIVSATVTGGERSDGKELPTLVEKARANGLDVDMVVGDGAYSEKANLELASDEEKGFKLVSKLNPVISEGIRRKEEEFTYNKDAGLFVCPAGHMAVKKSRVNKGKDKSPVISYFFDVDKCKRCPLREGCYKEGSKHKTYNVRILGGSHEAQRKYQESDEFKAAMKERYKIEAKNGELKNSHGYDRACYTGIQGMTLQGAMAFFASNIKRILTLLSASDNKQ